MFGDITFEVENKSVADRGAERIPVPFHIIGIAKIFQCVLDKFPDLRGISPAVLMN